jgi:serine/threonine protein kinase
METCIEMKSKCGSKGYMAPEIFNEEFYNEKIDDFSLAVILY